MGKKLVLITTGSFQHSGDCGLWKNLIIKPTGCTNFSNLFLEIKLYMFRTDPLSIIRSFSLCTQKWYMSFIQVCWEFASRIRMECPDLDRKLSANLYDVQHFCVYGKKTPDNWQRNCPKHVEFYSKNKFEKLVHLVGFIMRTYHWKYFIDLLLTSY